MILSHQVKQYIQNNFRHGDQKHGAFERHFGVIATALVQPDYFSVWGTDISPWDGLVNLLVTKSFGASFTFIKAIDGTLPARYFPENRQTAKNAGLITGAYGWLYRNANVSCVAQAQAYTNLLKTYPVDLPAVIDFEPTRWGGVASNPNYTDLRLWAVEFNRLNTRKPILYSAAYYMNQFGPMPADLKAMFEGIWIAHYGTLNPSMPSGWGVGEWLFHQNYSTGDAKLLSPNSNNKLEVDLNRAKDKATLERLAGVVVEPPPPGNGDNMIFINKVTTAALNGRAAPDTTATVALVFLQNDILVCDEERLAGGAAWRKVRSCIRGGVNVPLPAGGVWASDGSAGTLQGELSSFASSGDLANLSIHLTQELDIAGNKYVVNTEMTKA